MRTKETYVSLDQLPLSLTVDQVADVLRVGRSAAYRLVGSGSLRSVRIGKQLRVPKSAVVAFLENPTVC